MEETLIIRKNIPENSKNTYKRIILLVLIGFLAIYFITDVNYQVGYCQSNIGIGGHTAEAMRSFSNYETQRTESCTGQFHLTNITYNCQQKDILNCTTDWGAFRFPWSH